MLVVACNGGSDSSDSSRGAATESAPLAVAVNPASSPTDTPGPARIPQSVASTAATPSSGGERIRKASSNEESDQSELPTYISSYWSTDFSKHSVSYDEIKPAGFQRDGIPAIDSPKFHSVTDAPTYMEDNEPVFSLELNGEVRGYPLAIMVRHEIVNDEVGGVPVVVTYCPLCNSAIVFDRTVDGQKLDFGVTGNLRLSDLLMWDRQTESWWQQITGEAIVGEHTGKQLRFIAASVVSWGEFRDAFPQGKLLSRDTGFDIDYDAPSYVGYDSASSFPSLLNGTYDLRLPLMERVVGLTVNGQDVAYRFSFLIEHQVFNDSINGSDLVIFYAGETLSLFPGPDNSDRRRVGSTGAFESWLNGVKLTFRLQIGRITDEATGSTWNILGRAVAGQLAGTQLKPVVHGNHFWFAWAAFKPDTIIRGDVDFPSLKP